MKKLLGIVFAALVMAVPVAALGQVEANAGSMKLGMHFDTTFRWSPESQKNPDLDEIHWVGYESVTGQDVFLELTGKLGDRISYKILEGLVWEAWVPDFNPGTRTVDIYVRPIPLALPFEAYADFKIMDQLKFRFGKHLTPTLLANTGVHQMKIIHTANAPLIAETSSNFGPTGLNELLSVTASAGNFPRVPLPLSVTGASAMLTFGGLEITYTLFDEWLENEDFGPYQINWGDQGYDFNKTKGGNVALGYNGQLGPGKLMARGFYFDELTDVNPGIAAVIHNVRDSGWGLGMMYDADNFFLGGEYTTSTLDYKSGVTFPDDKNTWSGYYVILGGRFSAFEILYRLDYIDLNNFKSGDFVAGLGSDPDIKTFDTETWHTIGVNYLVNDQSSVGLNYVIRAPEQAEDLNYPNTNEFVLIMEIDLL